MVFNKATLISAMTSKDKRFGELTTAVQDSIIQSGINHTQKRTGWFRHTETNLLQDLYDATTLFIAPTENTNGLYYLKLLDSDGEVTTADVSFIVERESNWKLNIKYGSNIIYTGITLEVVWLYFPSVADSIDTNSEILDLIKYASYSYMYEYFEDTDRESRNIQRFDRLLGTSSISIISEFQDMSMKPNFI